MSQSKLNQKLSDREKCVHSIASLMGFFRRDGSSKPEPEMFKYLLETTRVAMFPTIPLDDMWKIADECDEQDKEVVKLTMKMVKYLEAREK